MPSIGKRLAEDVVLARRTEILTSIPGVSSITAAGLLTRMPELGRLDAKAVASLAGLAPVTRQSGAWQGRSFIQGGRPRGAAASLHAGPGGVRCNPDLRAKYRQLRGQGKPPKVALTAVMRKLLLLANARDARTEPLLVARPARTRQRGGDRREVRRPSPHDQSVGSTPCGSDFEQQETKRSARPSAGVRVAR